MEKAENQPGFHLENKIALLCKTVRIQWANRVKNCVDCSWKLQKITIMKSVQFACLLVVICVASEWSFPFFNVARQLEKNNLTENIASISSILQI